MNETGTTRDSIGHSANLPVAPGGTAPAIPAQDTAPLPLTPLADGEEPSSVPTIGTEEEFFVIDARTFRARARAPEVLSGARARHRGGRRESAVCAEITRLQVEATTPVCRSGRELYGHLVSARQALADAAREHGLGIAATGTAVIGDADPAPLTQSERYARIDARFGALRDAHTVCGCHIHVGVADREPAAYVANHLRAWTPVLLALSANSPFLLGRDTGHASWRAVTWARLPSAGPPPFVRSAADYDRAVEEMLVAGAILDRQMVYWDVRLSARLPTVEVRAVDAAGTAEEAVLAALLVRGLAAVALRRAAEGRPAPAPSDQILRLAVWRAAHDGLEGEAFDPFRGELVPARRLSEQMLEQARQGLDPADADLAGRLLDRVLAVGSGAHRQRIAYARRGRLGDVVELLVRQTRHGLVAVEG
ncbi:carboxylate-amine ligase [Nocardiopsis mwathae]|uniref:Putative glutamate--cysteine ligase 2 n=1 Tax=Nocardiopsis mwathae TaxID=1472723 RepID=A0A7W9YG52_9ACTN|nr:glutamate--cysteine ligase [Nocardiopsis mwathae]MBB6171487.1 carboxylate-amine ligase [Nocardiopsis mwathae]